MEWFDKRIVVHILIFIYVIRLVVLLSLRFFVRSEIEGGGGEDEEERLKVETWPVVVGELYFINVFGGPM